MHLSTLSLLGALCLGARATYGVTSNSTCDVLSSIVPDSIFFPESDTYNASISSYPFTQLRLNPTCILRPKSPQEISTAVHVFRAGNSTKFAVKGGGHNANAGFNNIEDGVTVDMQSLKDIELDDGVLRVGAGALWQDVYDVVEPHNVSVLGGRIGVVGVGGFLTGGGIAFFSPEQGWACDNVLNFEVVLASGEIVNANASSNPDLYTALKGGQNNFGIVTRFDLKTFPQGKVWGGRIFFAPEADEALVSAFTEFKNPDKYDPYAAGWVTLGYNGSSGQFTPTSTLWYTRPDLKPGAFAGITTVGPQVRNGMQEAYPGDFTRNASMVVKAASRRTIWAGTTFRISPTILHRIHSVWKELVPKISETYAYAEPASELTFQSIPPAPKNGSHLNSLGFESDSHPERNLVSLQVLFFFGDADATDGLYTALKDFIKMFNELAEEEGLKHDFIYLNYAGYFQDPIGGYGTEQVEKLKSVAKKYDPSGLFQRQLVGGFKLFK